VHGQYAARGWWPVANNSEGDADLTAYDDGIAESYALVLTIGGERHITSDGWRVQRCKVYNPLAHLADILAEIRVAS
jgi:hypothetical protein